MWVRPLLQRLCHELGVDYYVINGSDEGRFLDTVRNQTKNFASTVSFHQLPQNTKSSSLMRQQITQGTTYNSSYEQILRRFITTVFIFTCNYKNKIIEPFILGVILYRVRNQRKRETTDRTGFFSNVSKKSWIQKVLNMITRSW